MKRILLSAALLLFVGKSADANPWRLYCSATRQLPVTGGLNIGEWACNDPDGDTAVLNVSRCENFDVFYFLNRNGDATASTNTVQIRSCPDTDRDADACWPIENLTMTGVTPSEAIYGAGAVNVYGDFDAAINGDPRLIVHCNGPR